ncbi:cupin domain-containing protein [Albibacillus kandeliae]|uniref:cupin domain-containing protein n=1 Tax=Albibacillus kandeliae TaxID=2174228 RepID=UPI000D69550C|nr:cupin domain-containing protein [Albibacillus kandeliae]
MEITQIVSGPQGESHFEDYTLTLRYPDHGFEGFPRISAPMKCTHCVVVEYPAGYEGPQERSTHRQLAFCLSGLLRLTSSDGGQREFGPGDMIVMDDLDGKGHMITVLGNGPARVASVHMKADQPTA